MIIDRIREFMITCPFLDGSDVNVNCLGGKPICYSVEQSAAEPIVKSYCDGATLRRYSFIFAVRKPYDEIAKFNIEAAQLMEKVEGWIGEQNSKGCLPDLKNDRLVPQKIEVTSTSAMYDSTVDTTRLQMEIELLYRQKE